MDHDLNNVKEELYSPVLLDILDELHYRNQGMIHTMRPISSKPYKIFGTAFTMLATEVYYVPKFPYKKELESIDEMIEGDVMVGTTQSSMSAGFLESFWQHAAGSIRLLAQLWTARHAMLKQSIT